MSSIKPHDMETEKDDNAVPYFSSTSKKYVYPSGIEFECNILSLNKIKKERSFKGFPTNEDEEE
jgi:hypothetical protein